MSCVVSSAALVMSSDKQKWMTQCYGCCPCPCPRPRSYRYVHGNERTFTVKKCDICLSWLSKIKKSICALLLLVVCVCQMRHVVAHPIVFFLVLANFCQITINKTAVTAAVVIILFFLPKIWLNLCLCHFRYGIHVVHALVY